MADKYDDFWDVSKLVPKKTQRSIGQFATEPKVMDVVIGGDEDSGSSVRNISFDSYKAADEKLQTRPEVTYSPEGHTLIRSVTVKPSVDRFDFYDTFRKAALIYYDYKCARSDFVPFYSYKPQYAQMNNEQKKYYFFWRDELRQGRYLKTDYSYVYLYAYEILNLPDKIPAEEGLSRLVDVWCAYRKDLPNIDNNFAAWVQDYCLLYRLPCPFERIGGFIFDVIAASSFKEFYLSDSGNSGTGCAAMIAYLSDYDWRRGKYAGGDNAELYRAHLEAAMQKVISRLLAERRGSTETTVLKRSAFPGSLCTHSVKCNLEIEYAALSASPEMRSIVTSALKYTENKLRTLIGVKSRLAVKDLPDEYRLLIDSYFANEMARVRRERERANAPEYEKLYDAPDTGGVSFEDAIEIERASWRTTARLVEGSEEYEDEPMEEEPRHQTDTSDAGCEQSRNENDGRYDLGEGALRFLRAVCISGADAGAAVARELGMPSELLAEEINEAFADNFGDVILEDDGMGNFAVIEDYTEEIIQWLK